MDLISIEHKEDGVFSIKVRDHGVDSEIGAGDGGKDRGLSPAELYAGSLGACVAIMVRKYCTKQGYSDGDVGVSMTYELADSPKRIGAITIDLEVPNDVPEDRKEAIRRIVNLCPIHKTLENPPKVDVEIV